MKYSSGCLKSLLMERSSFLNSANISFSVFMKAKDQQHSGAGNALPI